MNSAFFVFDLVAGDTGRKRECNARGFVYPKFDDAKEAAGLVLTEKKS